MRQSKPNLHRNDADAMAGAFSVAKEQTLWQWAAQAVDFSRVPSYDTPIHGGYDPDYMPFWKEPQECIQDDSVREIVILKNSRAGYSENMCLIPLRWIFAQSPRRTMYLTGDQISAERFLQERIKRGMAAADECRVAMKGSRQTEHEIQLATMDFRVSWPRAKQAFKQDGWETIFCDEVDTWPEFAADMARKRCDTYPFHTLIFGSSVDPARKGAADSSPILSLYGQTDQRCWFLPEPGGDGWFRLELGGPDTKHGIKWDPKAKREDGRWDVAAVRETAHYITPGGAVMREADRMDVVRAGQWRATADAAPERVGFRVTQPMVPFASGSFGSVAAAFVGAAHGGSVALRTYFAEHWGEIYIAERDEVDENALVNRVRHYRRGEPFFAQDDADQRAVTTIMTIDVHRDWFQCVVRQWREPGESALVEWLSVPSFEEIDAIFDRTKSFAMFFDNHYAMRRMEVLDYCAQTGAYAMLGDDHIKLPYTLTHVDPYEGRRGGGKGDTVRQITWNVHEFRSRLLAGIRGETSRLWAVYEGIERDYVRQVTSTELRDGVWATKSGQSQDHLFDCEAMQQVAAAYLGVCR